MLSDLEKRVIASIQGDLPITSRPYLQIAADLGMREADLLEVLLSLRKRGVIRRFGATLRHQKSGYAANAMVAWCVAEDKIEEVGPKMAAFQQVSHCYRRDPTDQWPYNLYTMIHANDEQGCYDLAAQMASVTHIDTYTLLFSRRELKKTSMSYFEVSKAEGD